MGVASALQRSKRKLPQEVDVQTPISSDSLIVINKQAGTGSASLPETWNNLIRCLEVFGTGGAIEQHLVQAIDLAEMDAWRNVQAILSCGFDCVRDESGVLGLPQEALSGFLDFNVDIEQIPLEPHSVEQKRPKGKVLKFERPPHMRAVPPRNLVASDSTGTSAKIIEFRRPQSVNGNHPAGGIR
jgi:hypothetical protein